MKTLFLAVATGLLLVGAAQAETRDLSGFTHVNASGRFRVEVVTGEHFSVSVDGADAERVRTAVEDDTLVIEPRNRPWLGGSPRLDALVRVTLPRLEGASAAQGMAMAADVAGACGDFSAAAAMGASLTVTSLECATVEAVAAMGGDLNLTGACGTLEGTAAMGGNVNARALVCEHANVNAAMGGGVAAFAAQSYDATAAMGGSINLGGSPQRGDRSSSMGGSITLTN
jgi:hypothetical protein